MKRISVVLTIVLLFGTLAFGQLSRNSTFGNIYVPQAYNYGNNPNVRGGVVAVSNGATGAGSLYLQYGTVTLADGRTIMPYATSAAVIVGAGSGNAETITPSAVAGCVFNGAIATCKLTSTNYTKIHYQGEIVASGTSGYQEAVNDAALNGGGIVQFYNDERVTLATGATTTDTTANLLPATSLILGVTGRVTTTITTGCTGWELGDGTTAGRFTANDTTLTAGETKVGSVMATTGVASATTGIYQAAAAKVRITCAGAAPGAGKVHVGVWGLTVVPPAN